MYIPELLNSRQLFQKIAGWKKAGGPPELDTLLFRGTSAAIHSFRLGELNRACVQEFELFEEQLQGGQDRIVYGSSTLIEFLHEISPFFSSLIIMQNSLLPTVGKHLKISVPLSLHDVISGIKKSKLPKEIKDLTMSYWDSTGRLVRSYRDVDQHYDSLIKHTFLQTTPKKTLLVFLPDNPEEKSPRKFTYTQERDAAPFLIASFNELHAYIENVAGFLGFEPMPLDFQVRMEQLGDLRPFRTRTLILMIEKEVKQGRVNISALEARQLSDGRLSFQKKLISPEKLSQLNVGLPKKVESPKSLLFGERIKGLFIKGGKLFNL